MQKIKRLLGDKRIQLGGMSVLILLVLFGVYVLFQNSANNSSQRISDEIQAKLYLAPASGQFNNNSQISVDLMLDTLGQNVTGILAEIQYDNSKLTLNTIEKSGSSFGEDNVTLNPSFAANKVRILADKPEDNPVTGNGKKIATLKFTTKANGPAKLEFVGNNIVEIVSNGVSTNLTIETPSVEYQIGQQSTTITPTISSSITSTITPTISTSVSSTITPTTGATPQNCLPYGDVNGNGTVNQNDAVLVSEYLSGSRTLTIGQFSRADVNRDTQVQQSDYNLIVPLTEGKWSTVFPGNPILCPQLLPFHIGFKQKNTTLNVNNPSPTKNTIMISNPYKLPVSSVSFRGAYNSSAIRVTDVDALEGSFAAGSPDISQNDFNATIKIEPPISAQEFEIATIDVIPYVPGGASSASITFNSATFSVEVKRVGNETIPGSTAVVEGSANYSVIRSNTSTTQTPTSGSQPTGNPFATNTLVPTINASPPPGGASIRITASLPAVGTVFASDNKTVKEPNRQVQIQLVRAGSTTPITASGTLAFNGSAYAGYVIVPSVTAGSYQIKARLNNTLYKVIPGIYTIQDQSSINTSPVALNSGDVNQDNRIDLFDYNIILGCVQKKSSCTQTFRSLSDLDSNGVVEAEDYNIFLTQLDFREGD